MLMFVAEIAFLLELTAIAGGLCLLDKGRKDKSKLVNWAGWLLIVGGIGTALCTWYYSVKYAAQGAFDTATLFQTILV